MHRVAVVRHGHKLRDRRLAGTPPVEETHVGVVIDVIEQVRRRCEIHYVTVICRGFPVPGRLVVGIVGVDSKADLGVQFLALVHQVSSYALVDVPIDYPVGVCLIEGLRSVKVIDVVISVERRDERAVIRILSGRGIVPPEFVIRTCIPVVSKRLSVRQTARDAAVARILVISLVDYGILHHGFLSDNNVVGSQGLVESLHIIVAEVVIDHQGQGPARKSQFLSQQGHSRCRPVLVAPGVAVETGIGRVSIPFASPEGGETGQVVEIPMSPVDLRPEEDGSVVTELVVQFHPYPVTV